MKRHEIDDLIGDYDVLLKDRRVLIDRLRNAIDRYKTQPQNRDGRGIKHSVRKSLCKTVRRLGFLLHLSSEHPDPQIRLKVSKLLRSIPHHQEFDTLERQTSALVSKALESSRRHRLRTDNRVINVTKGLQLEELSSSSSLQRVGSHLGVCVRHSSVAHKYFRQVLCGELELWVVKRKGKVVGLISVEIECKIEEDCGFVGEPPEEPINYSRVMDDCASFDNKVLCLSHTIAKKILKLLEIEHVCARTFSQVGAFPIFLFEDVLQPIPEPLFDGVQWHYVWRTTYHMVIASTKKKPVKNDGFKYSKMKWSHFQSEPDNDWVYDCYTSGFLSRGDLLKLVLNFPSMYRLANDIRGDREDLKLSSEWI